MSKSKTIILVHGNFVNNKTWSEWRRRYEQRGYTVYTPANPGHEGEPAKLRTNIHPDLIKTGFIDVVNNLVRLIDSLSEKPLVIGHSMAGMAALKLLELDKASAAVSIDGAPPKKCSSAVFNNQSGIACIWIFFGQTLLHGFPQLV